MSGPTDPAADRRWTPWHRRPQGAGVLLDFDGTLAPIVDDPAAARPLAGAAETLAALAARLRLVAVVSGRPASFLAAYLAGSGALLSGLYGLESWRDGRVVTDAAAEGWRGVVTETAERAETEAPPQVIVERKGLSVTLHVRVAVDRDAWARAWAEDAAARTGLVLHPARLSYELRPPVATDKGTVVEALADGLDAACFVGDDRGDLPAFVALDRLQARNPRMATLRVGVISDEAPPELLAASDLIVAGPDGALALLDRLARG